MFDENKNWTCSHCGEQTRESELTESTSTWQQWQCGACGSWEDRLPPAPSLAEELGKVKTLASDMLALLQDVATYPSVEFLRQIKIVTDRAESAGIEGDYASPRQDAARAMLAALREVSDHLAGLANTGFVWSPDRPEKEKQTFAGALRSNERTLRAAIAAAEAAGITEEE